MRKVKLLTEKQQQYYDYVRGYIVKHWLMPTVRTSCKDLWYKSKRSITQFEEALKKKWFIDEDRFPVCMEKVKPWNEKFLEEFIIKTVKEWKGIK